MRYAQERLAQIRAPEERAALAKRIARRIFAQGEWHGETAERMAYKFGRPSSAEREGGGLCEGAMVDIIRDALADADAGSES